MTETTLTNKPSAGWRTLMKVLNPFMKWLLQSPLHGVVSSHYVLLTFTGRKSGRVYRTPVQYAQADNTLYVITNIHYVWWKNLQGGAAVQVHLRGKPYSGTAHTNSDPQQIRALLGKVYPQMPAAQHEQFAHGTIAITIQLMPNL